MQRLRKKDIIINYIRNNIKEYILVGLLLIIGVFVGVLVVNNCGETQMTEINEYISEFITRFKNIEEINKTQLFMQSIKNNLILAIILWLAGTTVIGMPIVLAVILYRGLCLGYTIAAITYTLGKIKGILFCFTSIFLQNILFIPAILTIGVSSIKLYKSIIKDKQKENIKIEIIRHTIISSLMVIVLIVSSVIENIISTSILHNLIKYF